MLDAMPDIGAAIREKMPWIPEEQPAIYLHMDNAGGHGTNAAVRECTQFFLDRHNIKHSPSLLAFAGDKHARPCTLWRSLQSSAETLHKDKRADANAIAQSVIQEAWDNSPSEKFSRVSDRVPVMVLTLIVEDGGGNQHADE